jgi:hypothetical protein
MKLTRSLLALALSFSIISVSFVTFPGQTALAQEKSVALQRGYRTGYSDGYMAGYRDSIDGAAKNFSAHNEYFDARRAYNKDYGTIEDFRDGYQQGFESGYDTGFEKRSFESNVPTGIARRGVKEPGQMVAQAPVSDTVSTPVEPNLPASSVPEPVTQAAEPPTTASSEAPVATSETPGAETVQNASYQGDAAPVIIIPRDTEIIVELNEDLSTDRSREGDKFTAKVVSPAELAGATVEGRVSKIQQPGRLKRRSEMLLAFDRIVVSETRWSNFNAILTEVLPVKGDNIKRVDAEGAAVGKGSFKEDGIKVGAATGTGAGIGAITAGPVGAAVGAGVGAAFGVGAVVIERGKHIHLNPSQQLRIRSTFESKIR